MVAKNFGLQEIFGWQQGWKSNFSKIKTLETPDVFIHLALKNLLHIFGEEKGENFKAVRFVVPVNLRFYCLALLIITAGKLQQNYILQET